jgi:hypothetical protein
MASNNIMGCIALQETATKLQERRHPNEDLVPTISEKSVDYE